MRAWDEGVDFRELVGCRRRDRGPRRSRCRLRPGGVHRPRRRRLRSIARARRDAAGRRPCLRPTHLASGKVRELYALDDERLLLVASDRISTFDVILPTPIPDKGRVLTGMSAFWFARTRGSSRTTCSSSATTVARSCAGGCEMLPVELVVRGYLSGSGWVDYRASGSVCGHALPPGLRESDRLPEPIVTPATKADEGHDLNINEAEAAPSAARSRTRPPATPRSRSTRSLRRTRGARDHRRRHEVRVRGRSRRSRHARRRGADAGLVPLLAGRRLQSRAGRSRRSTSSSSATGARRPAGTRRIPGPELPDDVVVGTRARYVEAFERLTEIPFADYLADPRVVLVRATVLVRPKEGILDPQGEAVEGSLRKLDFPVTRARVGRLVDLELDIATRPRRAAGRAHVRGAAREPADRDGRDRARGRMT